MGCHESLPTADADDSQHQSVVFKEAVIQGHPLACAMHDNWSSFLAENESRRCGGLPAGSQPHFLSKCFVKVYGEAEDTQQHQHQHQQLSYREAQRVAEAFMGYVVESLSQRNWEGSIRHTLQEAPRGAPSELAYVGYAVYTNQDGLRVTSPYYVKFSLSLREGRRGTRLA